MTNVVNFNSTTDDLNPAQIKALRNKLAETTYFAAVFKDALLIQANRPWWRRLWRSSVLFSLHDALERHCGVYGVDLEEYEEGDYRQEIDPEKVKSLLYI